MTRATEYSKDMQEKAETYLEKNTRVIPSVAGLAVFLKVARSTVYKWAKDQPAFSDTLDEILSNQELDATLIRQYLNSFLPIMVIEKSKSLR